MATVINNPGTTDSGGSAGMVFGILIAVLVIVLFVIFGLPALRGNDNGGTQINVPDKIDINTNSQPQQ